MNGQDTKIRRQISYDQCVCTGWVHKGLIMGEFLHSKRQTLRSSVTNFRISYNVGKGSNLKRFWPKIFNISQMAVCWIYDLIICLHIFVSNVLTQLLCSFLSSIHNTAEHTASTELSLSSAQGSTRLYATRIFITVRTKARHWTHPQLDDYRVQSLTPLFL